MSQPTVIWSQPSLPVYVLPPAAPTLAPHASSPSKTWINRSYFSFCTTPLFMHLKKGRKYVYQYNANTKVGMILKRTSITSWPNWPCGSAKRLFVSLSPCTPEVLAHMPASVLPALVSRVRTLPGWSGIRVCAKVCMCESADVCLHLLQLRGIVWHVTPDPAPLGRNLRGRGRLRFHSADVAACNGRLRIDVFTSGPAFICLYEHLSGLGTSSSSPTPNPVCVF